MNSRHSEIQIKSINILKIKDKGFHAGDSRINLNLYPLLTILNSQYEKAR